MLTQEFRDDRPGSETEQWGSFANAEPDPVSEPQGDIQPHSSRHPVVQWDAISWEPSAAEGPKTPSYLAPHSTIPIHGSEPLPNRPCE